MKKLTPKQLLALHKKIGGKIEITPKYKIENRSELAKIYTPGVGVISSFIAKNKKRAKDFTIKNNSVAVISDGSAVLGLGNIGPEAALPVMEGKAVIFKSFADIDAYPIVLDTQDPEEIIKIIKAISPTYGAINLEDISAPKCFQIEERLRRELNIPVLHDDQWGTAVVVLAGLINSLKLVNKKINDVKIVISGAGAAGTAIIKILRKYGARKILVLDRKGIIYKNRPGNTLEKDELAGLTNPRDERGDINDAMKNADVFIGVSSAGLVSQEMVKSMAKKSIIFALANPTPEITPDEAKDAGAYIVATGRSDFDNQLNNALTFPGIFRGALDNNIKSFSLDILIRASENLAKVVKTPARNKIIPSIFDKGVVKAVSKAVNKKSNL